MSLGTRIAVHCYEGDASIVRAILPLHMRHGFPITVMSPEDSAVHIPGVDCRVGGKRQSIGELAIARQKEHMKILLEYPEQFFLMHDADSLCLSTRLPYYLYQQDDVLWSNLVFVHEESEHAPFLAHNVPFVTLQPPVFAYRRTIERLLAVEEAPMDGYIDHWLAQAATRAGIPIKGFSNSLSLPISTSPGFLAQAQIEARYRGACFVHSVKAPRFWEPLLQAYQGWLTNGAPVDMTPPAEEDYFHPEWSGDRLEYKPGLNPPPMEATDG